MHPTRPTPNTKQNVRVRKKVKLRSPGEEERGCIIPVRGMLRWGFVEICRPINFRWEGAPLPRKHQSLPIYKDKFSIHVS